jgi:nucleotide-binding universal stress UspA family protein
MHKLLVPVDGSENALRAVRHAIGLAQLIGQASIHLVHAHDEPRVYGELAVYVPPDKMAAMQREHSETILAEAERPLKESGVAYTKEIAVGPVAQAIAECADRLGCDAIVMGTRGHSTIGNLLLGSVATKVVHLSRLPVTLVK